MTIPPDRDMINSHLGIELRTLREDAGFTAPQAAEVIGGQAPKISKIEAGKQNATPDEVGKLAEFYRAPAEHAKYLVELAESRPTGRRPRHSSARDAVPDWFRRFLALEWNADEIRTYQIESVHGLLQTADYVKSNILAWQPEADDRLVTQAVATRVNRQTVLRRSGRPSLRLEMVCSEGALRRVQGSRKIMRDQMQHLITMSKRPNIFIRVIPFETTDRITLPSGFSLFRQPNAKLSGVYLEDALGATYLREPDEFTQYSTIFGRLRSSALDPDDSRTFIGKVAESYR